MCVFFFFLFFFSFISLNVNAAKALKLFGVSLLIMAV